MKITETQAKFIKGLRCGDIVHSWRRIAELYIQVYGSQDYWSDTQADGIEMCTLASDYFPDEFWV